MESFNINNAKSFVNSHWVGDAINNAVYQAKDDASQLVSRAEHFVVEHKAALAVTAGATAIIGAIAMRSKAGSAAESLLPAAEKLLPMAPRFVEESHIGYEVTKLEPLTRTALVKVTSSKAETLAAQAASADWRHRYMAVSSWDASPELLASMSQDTHEQVRMMVAKNPLTPRTTLQRMMETDSENVRDAAEFGLERRVPMQLTFARDPRASAETLHRLATEELQAPKVREAVALNRESASHTLEVLARDPIPDIRIVTAMHGRTPIKSLDELSRDSNWQVRQAAGANKFVPDRALVRLSLDRHPAPRFEVASHWYTRPERLEFLSRDLNSVVRTAVANNPQTESTVLSHMSFDKVRDVRAAVATNPNVDAETLKRLSEDEEGLVRIAATKALRKRP